MTVNIGGRVFHIDEDAYDMLNKYLDRVRDELRSSEGGKEIYEDIERSIGELFVSLLGTSREVITIRTFWKLSRLWASREIFQGMPKEGKIFGEGSYRRMYRIEIMNYWWCLQWTGGLLESRSDHCQDYIFIILCIFGMAGGFNLSYTLDNTA